MRKKKEILIIFIVHLCLIFFSNLYSRQEEEKKKIDKYFNMTFQEMMEVEIISASRTPEKIGDIPASVVLITREDIETYGYRTLAEILENIPGLYAIDDYGEEGQNFGVRGFWSGVPNDNMIIMVNGITQENSMHSNYPVSKIPVPVEAIDRIEVIRGPMSVIYGQGAFYGIIHIFTNDFSNTYKDDNKGYDRKVNIATISIGSDKTKKLFVRAAGYKDNFNYVFNSSLYDTYGTDQPLSKMVEDTSILPYYGVSIDQRTGGRLENNEKYFDFSGKFNNFNVNLSYYESDREFYFYLPSYSDGSIVRSTDARIAVDYRKIFSEIFTMDMKFNYYQTSYWEIYDFLFDDFYGNQHIESNTCEIELNSFFKPEDKFEIKTGLNYKRVLRAGSMYNLPSFGTPSLINNYLYLPDGENIETRAFFAQVRYKPFTRLNIVGGIRLEQMPEYALAGVFAGGTENFRKETGTYNRDRIEIIPRFAMIYKFTDNNIFKLLYGKAINRPSFFQNSKNSLDPMRDDLQPEKIQTIEMNYIADISRNFSLSAGIFRNELNNLITRNIHTDASGNYITWSANAGKMITHGFELSLILELIKGLKIELNSTYQKTEDKRPGYENIATAYSPNLLGYIKAAYRTKGFTLSLSGNYVDDMETYWDETLTDEKNPFGRRIGDRVNGYFVLGANLRIKDILIKGLYINIRCSNIFNEEVRYPTFTNNQWATRGTIGPGRVFLFSAGFKF